MRAQHYRTDQSGPPHKSHDGLDDAVRIVIEDLAVDHLRLSA